MTESMGFTSRYEAMGIPYPDLGTVCRGSCEGCGVYPESNRDNPAWRAEHARAHTYKHLFRLMLRHREWWFWRSVLSDMVRGLPCDGWHFVKCADCGGTGKR